MQPLSGNQRPDLLTALMNMSLVLRLPRKIHLCRSSSNAPRLPSFLDMLQNPHFLPAFDKVHNPLRLPHETTSERPKVARACGVFSILTSKRAARHNGVHFFDISTSKSGPSLGLVCFIHFEWTCASGHNGVHFFDIATSKSGPNLRCFGHFDLEMCFAPLRRALFRHLNFQTWSERTVFFAFSLANALRATTACTFSTSHLPKVVRQWCVLYSLTWKCASRHNGVQFFISHLASWLRTPPSLLFSFLLFSILLLHLCFSFVHIVGSSTSKLPSNMSRDTVWQTFSLLAHDGNYYLGRPLARNVMYFKHGSGTFCIFLYPFYILVSFYPIEKFPQPI